MKELSMHILDIAQNSISAGANLITIEIVEDNARDIFSFLIVDDGCGMSPEVLQNVRNPFTTSRTTRKVGLGIPMLEQSCLQCGGHLELESEVGKGTRLFAVMEYNNIDRPPMGDIKNSMYLLILMNPDRDFVYRHTYNENLYELDTRELKEVLDGVPLNDPSVAEWLKDNIFGGIDEIYGVAEEE